MSKTLGRPTKYSDETVALTKSYLAQFYGKEYEALRANELADEVIPSMEGLAKYLNVGRRTLYDWKDEEGKEDFSHILDELQGRQAQLLINQGLSGKFNAQITKLVLGKHGYSEKVDANLGGQEGNPIKTDSTFNFIPVKNKD